MSASTSKESLWRGEENKLSENKEEGSHANKMEGMNK